MKRKGIILSGGYGSRLYPVTKVISKQLLPVFDKPMIYYPLSTLMLADVREILIISKSQDIDNFKELLRDGSQWGLKIKYAVQPSPEGIAQALIIGEEFLNGSSSVLILGDNIFYGHLLPEKLAAINMRETGATLFGYYVQDPERYGIAEFDIKGKVIDLVEKPTFPKSNYAVTGLYFYDKYASIYAKQVKPTARGELEITDLNKIYLAKGQLALELIDHGYSWLDIGTHESYFESHRFVKNIESSKGSKIACVEEIAFKRKWIDKKALELLAEPMLKNSYGKYLLQVIKDLENE